MGGRNNNQNLRIGIDVDGVLADFTTPYLRELNKLHGMNVSIDHRIGPTQWNWETDYGFHKPLVEKFWATTAQTGEFWRNMPIMPLLTEEEITRLQELNDNDHADVFFVSKCPLHCRKARLNWLTDEILTPCYYPPTLVHTDRKGPVAYGLHLNGFIDDKPKNLTDILASCGLDCRVLLLDQPWNRDFNHRYVQRVHSLGEGLDLLTKTVVN